MHFTSQLSREDKKSKNSLKKRNANTGKKIQEVCFFLLNVLHVLSQGCVIFFFIVTQMCTFIFYVFHTVRISVSDSAITLCCCNLIISPLQKVSSLSILWKPGIATLQILIHFQKLEPLVGKKLTGQCQRLSFATMPLYFIQQTF